MKPRIALDRVRRGVGKWHCWSPATASQYGNAIEREGKGYTLAAAYVKWQRCPRRW